MAQMIWQDESYQVTNIKQHTGTERRNTFTKTDKLYYKQIGHLYVCLIRPKRLLNIARAVLE